MQGNTTPAPKKKRGLIVVAAVLLLLAAGYFGLTLFLENDQLNKDAILADELQVTGFAKIDSFSYTDDNGNSMSYTYNGIDWLCAEYEGFPLRYKQVQDMANAFADIIALRTLEDHASLEEYGLDTPQYTLELHDGDYSATVLFGNPASTGWYVSVEGRDAVYVVDATLLEEFVFNIYDILKFDRIPGFLQNEVQGVDLIYNGHTYHYKLNHAEDALTSESTIDGAPIDITYLQVMDALKVFDEWKIDNCVLYNATEAELSAYGFDEPFYTIVIDIFDVSEEMSKTIKVTVAGLDEEGDNRYLMVNDNMQVLYTDDTDAEDVIIDLTTVGLEELRGGISLEDLVGKID